MTKLCSGTRILLKSHRTVGRTLDVTPDTPVEDQETREGMMDVKSLSNSELKEQLLKLGVKPGPILPSTRRVYEKKLVQLMVPEVEQNNAGHQEQYSDSEDEGSPVMSQLEVSDDIGAIYEMHSYSKRNVCSSNNMVSSGNPATRRASLHEGFIMRSPQSPYMHMDTRSSLGHVASYTRENGRRVSLNQTDADTTDLPDPISQSQLRISATCRKSIKGAAGRPIQFKYDDLVAKERMWELSKEASAKTGKERLVSVPLQIALFVVVTLFAVLLYSLTGSPENPFVALSESHP
uniref:LEM domain-containing protein n=1 Tax=Leptobrachium leishanense TaxID=445787 RepID=A0A8C5LNX9_9ANUR